MSSQAGEKKGKERFYWKRNLNYDLELLNMVESLNPYSVSERKSGPIWDEVAKQLREGPLTMDVNQRSCRDRLSNLLEPFKKKEALSMLQSGVAEDELDEIRRLLTNIAALERDRTFLKSNKAYNAEKRKDAEQIRTAALKSVKEEPAPQKKEEDIEIVDEAENENSTTSSGLSEFSSEDNSVAPSPPSTDADKAETVHTQPKKVENNEMPQSAKIDSRKRTNVKDEVLDFMKTKFAKSKETDELGLKVRLMEAQNRSKELDLQKEKHEEERAEKKRMNDLMFMILQNQLKGTVSPQPPAGNSE